MKAAKTLYKSIEVGELKFHFQTRAKTGVSLEISHFHPRNGSNVRYRRFRGATRSNWAKLNEDLICKVCNLHINSLTKYDNLSKYVFETLKEQVPMIYYAYDGRIQLMKELTRKIGEWWYYDITKGAKTNPLIYHACLKNPMVSTFYGKGMFLKQMDWLPLPNSCQNCKEPFPSHLKTAILMILNKENLKL